LKPSDQDQHEIDSSQSGTLRFDLLQSGALPSENSPSGAQGSTKIAGQTTNNQSKNLDPTTLVHGLAIGDAQQISLPSGGGWVRLSFFFQKKEALWHQILEACLKLSGIAASNLVPVFDVGAVGKKDWTAIDTMLASLFPPQPASQNTGATSWLFSPSPQPMVASQKAFATPEYAGALPLIKGAYYLLVPEAHYQAFATVMNNMTLSADGYLIPKTTSAADKFTAIWNTPELRGITYLTLHCEDISETPTSNCNKPQIPAS
jgi:hypothetical protein